MSLLISRSRGCEGLGFVVRINTAQRPSLPGKSFSSGLAGCVLEGEMARIFNLPPTGGPVAPDGSPTDLLGIQVVTVQALISSPEVLLQSGSYGEVRRLNRVL